MADFDEFTKKFLKLMQTPECQSAIGNAFNTVEGQLILKKALQTTGGSQALQSFFDSEAGTEIFGSQIELIIQSALQEHKNKEFMDSFAIASVYQDDPFAIGVADYLGKKLVDVGLDEFKGSEVRAKIKENIRRKEIYLIFTLPDPEKEKVGESKTKLEMVVNAFKQSAGAKRVYVVAPDLPYSRQDKDHGERECVTARLLAKTLQAAGCDHVISMDLHAEQIAAFYDRFDSLKFRPILVDYILRTYSPALQKLADKNKSNWFDHISIVSPDAGGALNAESIIQELTNNQVSDIAFTPKIRNRKRAHSTKTFDLVGDVEGTYVETPDDILATGGTLFGSAEKSKKAGALYVLASCAHALGYDTDKGPFIDRLINSDIDELVVTNSRPQFEQRVLNSPRYQEKVTVLSVIPYFAEAIKRIQQGETVKEMVKELKESNQLHTLYKISHQSNGIQKSIS